MVYDLWHIIFQLFLFIAESSKIKNHKTICISRQYKTIRYKSNRRNC